jgi:exonuclease III
MKSVLYLLLLILVEAGTLISFSHPFIAVSVNTVIKMQENLPQNGLSGIKFSSLNVNSLNISHSNQPMQLRKLFGILKLKSDIIFSQDVRLSSRNLVSSKDDILRLLQNNVYGSYSAIFNSSKNKRGVGILINNNISFTEEQIVRDDSENILLSWIRINGNRFILGSVYGPNNHDPNFF